MRWLVLFFRSGIGKKVIMSLTGLFLVLFLIVHLVGNLQLLNNDGGESFNTYAYFMTHNPLIKMLSYGLYFFILLHAIQGVVITLYNRSAKGTKYARSSNDGTSWASKNMMALGVLIFAFLCIHMGDFWWKMKSRSLDVVQYAGFDHEVQDLYARVAEAYSHEWIVIVYLIGLVALGFHLVHGFQSAFTTLGLRHKKYTPLINGIGWLYSVVVTLGFAIIPIWMYFNN